MEYVEMLRARRVLTWYGGITLVLLALGLALAFKDGPPQIHINNARVVHISLRVILAAAAFGPLILAAFLAVGFDAEYKTIAITWTRPRSRIEIALRYLAVDFAALIAAWLFTVLLVLLTLVIIGLGRYLDFTGNPAPDVLAAFGCAVMWYGLVVLVTALLPGHGKAIAGASWAYALISPSLAQIPFPSLLHEVMVAFVYLNPLAYYVGFSSNGAARAILPGSTTMHALVTWLIGIVAIAIGIRIWATREVPA